MILKKGCYVLFQGEKGDVKWNDVDDESRNDNGIDETDAATREAKAAQVFTITVSLHVCWTLSSH